MRRLASLTFISALVWLAMPLSGAAQELTKMPRIGIIATQSPVATWRQSRFAEAFLGGLRDLGYDEGRKIAIEYRSAEGNWERLPAIAAELVRLEVDLIVAATCGAALNAARRATSTIPIVVATCNDDMVEAGIVASLAQPGGNVTGLQKLTPELATKRLELLKEMLPDASRVAVLWDPGYSAFAADWRELKDTARAKAVALQSVEARRLADLEEAFAAMVRERADAVITLSDTMTYNFPDRFAALAVRHKLPLMSPFREIAEAGGLMSYGPSIPDINRRAASYVDKILKGARPADLPVGQPTKFELVINLQTAKALGLEIPLTLLARADEVIE
ncbi:MAG TPA: ABC transporter substrate-binding protein [Alphaproteobacteria bacterium]|nr:ABC transporter substrate-binding protein [Alphaproteobacteria bacterium]